MIVVVFVVLPERPEMEWPSKHLKTQSVANLIVVCFFFIFSSFSLLIILSHSINKPSLFKFFGGAYFRLFSNNFFSSLLNTTTTVSYTHLDVYKRQMLN